MGAKPLVYFVDFISYIYDSQKEYVADAVPMTTYIGSPDPDALYATPGLGNLSSDGVHPSTKGYQWWAHHIAEQIELNDPERPNVHSLSTLKSGHTTTESDDSSKKEDSNGNSSSTGA